MTYGWAILIIVIVAAVLYSLGIFNPSASVTATVTGFSGLGSVSADCYSNFTYQYGVPGNNAGGLLVQIGNVNSEPINVTSINVTSATGTLTSYSEIFNSSETPSVIVSSGGEGYLFVPLVCPKTSGASYAISVTIAYRLIGATFPGPYFSTGQITGTSGIGQLSNVTSNAIGLTSYWPIRKGSGTTAYDVSGHLVNAGINGATWTTGSFGTALQFSSTDYMVADYPANQCGSIPSVPCNSGSKIGSPGETYLPTLDTFSMWVNPSALDVSMSAAEIGGCDRDIAINGSGQLGTSVWSGGFSSFLKGTPLSANTWYFLVFTMQSDRFAFYVDGQLYGYSTQGTGNGIEGPFSSGFAGAGAFQMGGQSCGLSTNFFQGMVKDVRVYDHGLTPQEIQDIYQYNALI